MFTLQASRAATLMIHIGTFLVSVLVRLQRPVLGQKAQKSTFVPMPAASARS